MQKGKVCLGHVGIAKLFVNVVDKLRVLDEVTRSHAILIFEGLNLFSSKVEIEDAESRGKGGLEFIVDAVSLTKFIVILEKGFNADLFFPYFGSNSGFDVFDTGNSVLRSH